MMDKSKLCSYKETSSIVGPSDSENQISSKSEATTADQLCMANPKTIHEKTNVELIAKVREQEEIISALQEENAQAVANLRDCQENCRNLQQNLEVAEQKLVQLSQNTEAGAWKGSAQEKEQLPSQKEQFEQLLQEGNLEQLLQEKGWYLIKIPQFERKLVSADDKFVDYNSSKQNSISICSSSCSDASDDDGVINKNVNADTASSLSSDESDSDVAMNKEIYHSAININALPDTCMVEIFSYLSHNDLGQTARVCKKWNELTRDPVLWKRVDVILCGFVHKYQTSAVKKLIKVLPSSVTCLKLNFRWHDHWSDLLDFGELCGRLRKRCPQLEMLMLDSTKLSVNLPRVIGLCTMVLVNLRRLIIHSSIFPHYPIKDEEDELCEDSKIELLDLYNCYITMYNKPPFSMMPHLKTLRLFGTDIDDSWIKDDRYVLQQLHELDLRDTDITFRTFKILVRYAPNLRELYLCDCSGVYLDDDDRFHGLIFPHLETICLRYNSGTGNGVVSFVKACPSLKTVYIDEDVVRGYKSHPYIKLNKHMRKIVKDDCCYYNKSRNY